MKHNETPIISDGRRSKDAAHLAGRNVTLRLAAGALLAALAADAALAQTALPTIDIGRVAARRASTRPAKPAVTAQRAAPAPARVVAPTGPPAAPAQFVPQGTQIGRGPTGVVGYAAAGTSTATKTNTPIMDIPQSITILTKQQLEDRASQSLGQALTYVPGVTVVGGEGNTDQISIRGQTTTADFFKDGVRDDAEYYRDLYNIQAVEVLKGPSALIFGRGGGGGVVNRVTKKADGETIRNLEVSTGSFGRKRVTVDLGQAVSDTVALRLNALYEQSYSYRNFFRLERYGVNPTLTWKPAENTFLTVSYEHFHDRRTADRGIPSIGGYVADGLVIAPGYPAPAPNWAFFGAASPSAQDLNFSRADVNSADVNFQHKTDFGLEIRNHTVYANYRKGYQNTFPEGPFEFEGPGIVEITGYKNQTPRANIFNQTDFVYKFAMSPDIRHTLLAGAEIGNQRSSNSLDFPCFNLSCETIDVDTPFVTPTIYTPVSFATPLQRRHTNLDLAAGYVQDQIEITKYIDVLAGVRFDRFDLHFTGNDIPPPPGLVASDEIQEGGGTVRESLHRVDNLWSPRFGLVFKPFEGLSLYGSYSRSYLPMAGDQFTFLAPTLANLAPQGFQNFEAGFKAQLAPNLYFTGAIYQLNRSNQPLVANALSTVTANTQTNGGELALTGNVTDLWQVSVGYGHQGAYIRNANGNPDPAAPLFTASGKSVPFVPKNNFSFWNKYDLSSLLDLNKGVLGVGAGVIHNTRFYAAVDNAVIVPGYTRVDGAVFLKLSDRISGQINVENILGAHYYATASSNNNIMPGAPRSAYVTFNAKF